MAVSKLANGRQSQQETISHSRGGKSHTTRRATKVAPWRFPFFGISLKAQGFTGLHPSVKAIAAAKQEMRSYDDSISKFRSRAMRQLVTMADGRRLAIDVMRALRESGTEGCKATGKQTDSLVWALLILKERGSYQALIGFSVILTDAAGARGSDPVPELYESYELDKAYPAFRLKRLKRLVERDLWSAAVAAWNMRTTGEGR